MGRRTGLPPLMLGPVLLHRSATTQPYSELLRALKDELELQGRNVHVASTYNVAIGSDGERAIAKAIQQEFPDAVRLVCSRHLRENFGRYMTNKAGISEPIRKQILHQAFAAKSDEDLAEVQRVIQLLPLPTDVRDKLGNYYEEHVRSVRTQQIVDCHTLKLVPELWTNNNCESINHVLKSNIKWKPCKTVCEIISVIQSEVALQLRDLRRSLYGEGNYTLAPAWRNYQLSWNAWNHLTSEQQDVRFRAFLQRQKPPGNISKSKNGLVTMPNFSSIARKPGQRKRPRSQRVEVSTRAKRPRRHEDEEFEESTSDIFDMFD